MEHRCVRCDRPATWLVIPQDDPDLLPESWHVCDEHVAEFQGTAHGVERLPFLRG